MEKRLSPCLFNLYTEYIMQNAELDESQAGIKIAGTIDYLDWVTIISEWPSLWLRTLHTTANLLSQNLQDL